MLFFSLHVNTPFSTFSLRQLLEAWEDAGQPKVGGATLPYWRANPKLLPYIIRHLLKAVVRRRSHILSCIRGDT